MGLVLETLKLNLGFSLSFNPRPRIEDQNPKPKTIHGDINNCALLISALSASLRDKKVSRRGAEAAENVNRG
jgi:hypothetical protein